MERFKFNGEWEYELDLQKFMKSNSKWGENIGSKSLSCPIKLKIIDQKDFEPDPSKEQIDTINYIIANEKFVLDSLCKAFQTINKFYGDNCGEHDWYSNDLKYDKLGMVFLISEIEIFTEHKNGKAYFQLSGEYKGDYEHGLIVAMHQDKLIDYNQIGEDCYGGIYKDLGEEGTKFRDFNINHQNFGEDKIHKPIPKYGKFKPWQLNTTGEYFDTLLRQRNNQKLIEELESSSWNVNLRFPHLQKNLLDKAAYKNNVEIIEYLVKRGADSSQTLDQAIHKGFFYKETVKCLVDNGVSINSLSAWGMTPLCHEIKNYVWYLNGLRNYKEGDLRIERANKEIKDSKEKIRFYLSLGANHTNLDKEGRDYKSFLINGWNKEFLDKNDVISKVEELLFPDKPQKSKWKFWK